MRSLLVLLAVVAAVSAVPYKFDRDIKINVYDVLKSLYAAAPLSTYVDHITKQGEFRFQEYPFKYYPEQKLNEVLVVYKPKGENYLHGYYVRSEDVSKYDDSFFNAVHPIYEYLNSGEYYAFTPYAAQKAAPQYFNYPLKNVFYQYYKDADIHRDIPVVFLVPKSEVDQAALDDYVLIAEYEVNRDASHIFHEHFDHAGKSIARRDVLYTSPYYRAAYPYAYAPTYRYEGYPYSYYGYPEYTRTGHWY